ncbi:hypothetical protein CBW18_12120 [Pedobacter sp. AJM]|jgi:hypothetical protein|nr:hypothetical protein CBW18_12120 [Pedobacter sp. AJM]
MQGCFVEKLNKCLECLNGKYVVCHYDVETKAMITERIKKVNLKTNLLQLYGSYLKRFVVPFVRTI